MDEISHTTIILTVLNLVIIILMTVLAFIGRRLFRTQDEQFKIMHSIREFIHRVDKRVLIIETLSKDKMP